MSIKSQIEALQNEKSYALKSGMADLVALIDAEISVLQPLQEIEDLAISMADTAFDQRDAYDDAFADYYDNLMDTLTEQGWTRNAQVEAAVNAFGARRAELLAR
jgi:hypothetical protein